MKAGEETDPFLPLQRDDAIEKTSNPPASRDYSFVPLAQRQERTKAPPSGATGLCHCRAKPEPWPEQVAGQSANPRPPKKLEIPIPVPNFSANSPPRLSIVHRKPAACPRPPNNSRKPARISTMSRHLLPPPNDNPTTLLRHQNNPHSKSPIDKSNPTRKLADSFTRKELISNATPKKAHPGPPGPRAKQGLANSPAKLNPYQALRRQSNRRHALTKPLNADTPPAPAPCDAGRRSSALRPAAGPAHRSPRPESPAPCPGAGAEAHKGPGATLSGDKSELSESR